MLLSILLVESVLASRVAVFGGSGFIGSRVCRKLGPAGCEVVSISRGGGPPAWASSEPWAQSVEWVSADALAAAGPPPLGPINVAVSCIGNVRPAPSWAGFWGLRWEDDMLRQQNGDTKEAVMKHARFVLVSVSSDVQEALGGALKGYIQGKRAGESAARAACGERAAVVDLLLVLGGGRLGFTPTGLAALLGSPPVVGYLGAVRWLKKRSASGYGAQDVLTHAARKHQRRGGRRGGGAPRLDRPLSRWHRGDR